jgi:hypothetical protein
MQANNTSFDRISLPYEISTPDELGLSNKIEVCMAWVPSSRNTTGKILVIKFSISTDIIERGPRKYLKAVLKEHGKLNDRRYQCTV